jgi:hypothetical protein
MLKQLDNFCYVFFVLELADAVIFPDMPYEGFDIAAHRLNTAVG